jgi:hypothetical protein
MLDDPADLRPNKAENFVLCRGKKEKDKRRPPPA